jgi:hypothetical protein
MSLLVMFGDGCFILGLWVCSGRTDAYCRFCGARFACDQDPELLPRNSCVSIWPEGVDFLFVDDHRYLSYHNYLCSNITYVRMKSWFEHLFSRQGIKNESLAPLLG